MSFFVTIRDEPNTYVFYDILTNALLKCSSVVCRESFENPYYAPHLYTQILKIKHKNGYIMWTLKWTAAQFGNRFTSTGHDQGVSITQFLG